MIVKKVIDISNIAVILAGGVGRRFGTNTPKQFVEVFDKPVLAYTIETFEKHNEIDAIEIVCVEPYITFLKNMVEKYNFSKVKWITAGGSTFQESVLNGVTNLMGKIKQTDIILVHFGASPFVSNEIISDSIRVCNLHGNAISSTDFYLLSGKKNKNTSVSDSENYSTEYINRDTIACMSTPHAFKFEVINRIYRKAIDNNIMDSVEPHTTSLMYALNEPIYFSKGSQINIKITNKEDIDLFKGYILSKTNE